LNVRYEKNDRFRNHDFIVKDLCKDDKKLISYIFYRRSVPYGSIPAKILVCQRVPKKSTVLACLTMAKLKMNRRVPNKNADLLKKISVMGTEPYGKNWVTEKKKN